MAGLAGGRFPASPEAQRAFFEKHVAPWMGRLFADMENARERQILPVGRSARPAVSGNRSGAFTFAELTGERWSRRDGDERRDKKATVGRRDFLRKVGVGALGAGATLATPLDRAAQADSETNDEKRKARYKETDHVKAYYRVNRYPS